MQVGLRGYWPPQETFDWMQEHGLRWHFMREIEERGAEAVIADAIAEALDGPDVIYLSLDIDVIDPGMAPGTGTPEPGGMLTREVLRAVRQIVGAVDLAGMDIVEVSPPYDQAETTAMAANRAALEAISALALKRQAGGRDPLGGLTAIDRRSVRRRGIRRRRRDDLARLYDLDLVDDPGDLDLYLALAERTGGPILELAAGTGRLAVPLAAGGDRVTAVDLDPAMLARARARAAAAGPDATERLTLVEADLVGLRLPDAGPLRPGVHRPQLDPRPRRPRCPARRRVQALADHLAPGGVAVVDIWLPDAEDLARFDGRIILEWPREDPETGEIVTKAGSAQHDAATGTIDADDHLRGARQGGPARRWVRRDRMRLVSAAELAAFAEEAGLAVEMLAGGYDLGALGPGSERAVLIAVKP